MRVPEYHAFVGLNACQIMCLPNCKRKYMQQMRYVEKKSLHQFYLKAYSLQSFNSLIDIGRTRTILTRKTAFWHKIHSLGGHVLGFKFPGRNYRMNSLSYCASLSPFGLYSVSASTILAPSPQEYSAYLPDGQLH